MKNVVFGILILSFTSSAFAVCPSENAERSSKLAAIVFAEMRGMSGGLSAKATKTTFTSAAGELQYSVVVKAGGLGSEIYKILIDGSCLPSAIEISDGLEL